MESVLLADLFESAILLVDVMYWAWVLSLRRALWVRGFPGSRDLGVAVFLVLCCGVTYFV